MVQVIQYLQQGKWVEWRDKNKKAPDAARGQGPGSLDGTQRG